MTSDFSGSVFCHVAIFTVCYLKLQPNLIKTVILFTTKTGNIGDDGYKVAKGKPD